MLETKDITTIDMFPLFFAILKFCSTEHLFIIDIVKTEIIVLSGDINSNTELQSTALHMFFQILLGTPKNLKILGGPRARTKLVHW